MHGRLGKARPAGLQAAQIVRSERPAKAHGVHMRLSGARFINRPFLNVHKQAFLVSCAGATKVHKEPDVTNAAPAH